MYSSYETPSSSPVPFLIARRMLSLGMLTARAAMMAARRRELPAGSPPPVRAAVMSSRVILVKALPRAASAFPFLCLIELHLLWPDMEHPLSQRSSGNDPAGPATPEAGGRNAKPPPRMAGQGLVYSIRRRPTLPRGSPRSTIGAGELNCRVRDGNGCFLSAIATERRIPRFRTVLARRHEPTAKPSETFHP